MPFFPSKKWIAARVEWRHKVLAQIRAWVEERGERYDKATHNVILRRLDQLERLERAVHKDAPAHPYDPADAAAMIVLPRWRARQIARTLFHQKPFIDSWMRKINLDWFTPKDYPAFVPGPLD